MLLNNKLTTYFSRQIRYSSTYLQFMKNGTIPKSFEPLQNARFCKFLSTLSKDSNLGHPSFFNRMDILHLKRSDSPLCYKHTTSLSKLQDERKSLDYEVIYLIERLRTLRTICKLNKISTICATVGSPSILGIGYMGILPMQTAQSLAFMFIMYAAFFLGPAVLISKVVGKMMISTNLDYLKISHLSVFGNRRDIYLSVNDLMPLQQSEEGVLASNIKILQFKNVSKKFIFLPQSGDINSYHTSLEMLLNGELGRDKKGEKNKL
ncbi:unnamed protein product [Lymnaea stagnalis]|uniref:Transmembrane protein 186 n=1 Tax=Lymnaea stagnalis TaxID=6523 RepID=A0AAV2GYC6_LYMST